MTQTMIRHRERAPVAISGRPKLLRWRCDVDTYMRMCEEGIIGYDVRTELIRGEILVVPPPGPVHSSVVDRMNEQFVTMLAGRAITRIQGVLPLDRWSMPLPDTALLRPRDDFYFHAAPTPADALLVVEVSFSTLAFDLRVKLPLYAEVGIPEVWIAVVAPRKWHIEAYRDPEGLAYRTARTYGPGEAISLAAFPDVEWQVDALLGPFADRAKTADRGKTSN